MHTPRDRKLAVLGPAAGHIHTSVPSRRATYHVLTNCTSSIGVGTWMMAMFHRFPRSPGHPPLILVRKSTPFLGLYRSFNRSTVRFQGALQLSAGLEIAQMKVRDRRLLEGIHKELGLTSLCTRSPKALCLQKIRCSPRSGQGRKYDGVVP